MKRLDKKFITTKCLHIDPPPPVREDMAGYHGPLHNTLTLACLSYIGHMRIKDELVFMVRDKCGEVYRLKSGDFVGERGGYIQYGDEDEIQVNQRALLGDREDTVTLPRIQ